MTRVRTMCRFVLTGLLAAPSAGATALPPKGQLVRGIYAHPGPAIDSRIWASYGRGYEFDDVERHSGEVSIKCANASDAEAHGAVQEVVFDQDKPRPLIVAGWAKLQGVAGPADYHCSVYLDLRLKDGKSWPMKIAAFDPEKQGWQYAEATYEPPAPIATARVYVFLRERAGTAWFDDIYVGERLENGRRSPNLLQAPGFEQVEETRSKFREEFFRSLRELGCNAFHVYRSVPWQTVMETDELPAIKKDDPFFGFVRDAHRRGFKVWVTVGLGLPSIEGPDSRDFPIWGCVNNRWGEAYTRAVAYMTQYGIDGIGVVPDEWNYNTSPVSRLKKHKNPEVAQFFASLGSWCNCPKCQELFQQAYGVAYPNVRQAWRSDDAIWAQFTQFRYTSTTNWIARTVKAAKAMNPRVVTDTMICVLPVCSDNRLATGAAWDQIGAGTELDCLQTDPYILLHNYLGDSTHLYPTETTLHLGAANFARRCGVTLEACRLRDKYRQKDPVEIYGAALSCWMHGASEFFWWHLNYITGASDFVDPERPKAGVRSVYKVMQDMEPYLARGQVSGEVLVCYSRRSEDSWDWLSRADATDRLNHSEAGAKRGFLAHRNTLYALLRRGYPFRMTFLEHPDPECLAAAKALLVPFPFALAEAEVEMLREQAQAGKTVILMSELSPVDELGRALEEARLAGFFKSPPDPAASEPVLQQLGAGHVIFLGDDFAVKLLEAISPEKDPTKKVPLPPMDMGRVRRLDSLIAQALGRPGSLFVAQPERDIEAAFLVSPRAYVILAINWDCEAASKCELRLPVPGRQWTIEARRILPGGEVRTVTGKLRGNRLSLQLEPQEAYLGALKR